MAYPSRSSPLG